MVAFTNDSWNNDVWYERRVDNGVIYQNKRSELCIVVRNSSTTKGEPLIQYSCNGTPNGVWTAY